MCTVVTEQIITTENCSLENKYRLQICLLAKVWHEECCERCCLSLYFLLQQRRILWYHILIQTDEIAVLYRQNKLHFISVII